MMMWKVQIYVGHKPDGEHLFHTKEQAYAFYVASLAAINKSTIGGRVEAPVRIFVPIRKFG